MMNKDQITLLYCCDDIKSRMYLKVEGRELMSRVESKKSRVNVENNCRE